MGTSMSLQSRRLRLLTQCFSFNKKQQEELKIKIPCRYKVYFSKCENNAWFIGITTKSLESQLQDNLDNIDEKTVWTRINKPLSIHLQNEFDSKEEAKIEEHSLVILFMLKYGINNVRGGKYWYPILNKTIYVLLQNEISKLKKNTTII